MTIINIPKLRKVNGYLNTISTKNVDDYKYLLYKNINDIVLFEDSKEEEDYISQGKIVLPRFHTIAIGTKDNEPQLVPYGYDPNRIVVSTLNNIIIKIESIG